MIGHYASFGHFGHGPSGGFVLFIIGAVVLFALLARPAAKAT